MSETKVNDASPSNETSAAASRPPMVRAATLPTTPTSPLATNPWYQKKFELVCYTTDVFRNFFCQYNFCMQYRDVIEEKVRDEYPDLPQTHKLQPANIEHSNVKGYDLDFPVCNS